MRLKSRHERERDHRELVPVDLRRPLGGDQVADRFDADEQRAGEQDRGLAERAEVLGAAVAVGMAAVGGPPAEAHGEEGQHRGDHVAAGLDPGGDQAEAVRREAHAELDRHEHGRRRRSRRAWCAAGVCLLALGVPRHRCSLKRASPAVRRSASDITAGAYRGCVTHDRMRRTPITAMAMRTRALTRARLRSRWR